MAAKPQETAKPGRVKQLRMAARLLHQVNPKALPLAGLAALATLAIVLVIGAVTGYLWYALPLGLLTAFTVGFSIFGRSLQGAQYAMVEGQPGAAAAVLQAMRGNWTVTPGVAANRDLDVVHRVVGRPGVVLVSEGPPGRVARMLAAEKKKIARVAYDVPIYDLQCGDAEGQVPLRKLQRRITKLPRNLKKPAVAEINYRLKALPQSLPVPKSPLPKNVRMPRGVKRHLR